MIIVRSMHEGFRSNAWLVAAGPGGSAVIIDTGAPLEPLHDAIDEHGLEVACLLNTHEHHDHTLGNMEVQERYGVDVLGPDELSDGQRLTYGDLDIEILATPGHCESHVAFLVNGTDCFTGDCIFRGTVGGTIGGGLDGYEHLRESIMLRLLALPATTALHPGHMESTTVQAELDLNPFVRLWRGLDEPLGEQVDVAGNPATLLLWAPDYDGGSKALVGFADGSRAIVGGSRVERSTTTA